MEPEAQPAVEKVPLAAPASVAEPARQAAKTLHDGRELRDFEWAFIGPHGLRAGWSIVLFAALYYLFRSVVGTLFFAAGLVSETNGDSAAAVLVGELIPFFALVGAAAVMGLIEDRSILNYNLAGPRRMRHFLFGLAAGFAALSLLVGTLAWGGWLRTGPAALSAAQSLRFAALWACAFLIVGSVEEGLFRCYALSTLTRGINFWWALATQIAICLYLPLTGGGNGAWGVYLAAALGFFPCLVLHQRAAARSAFWQAAWVTSTVFGLYHTSNGGENWIGILAAVVHRLRVLCERPRHRLGLVGDRLPRGLGLGRNLLLRHRRQWPPGARSLPDREPGRQSAVERRRRRPGGQLAGPGRYSAAAFVPHCFLSPPNPRRGCPIRTALCVCGGIGQIFYRDTTELGRSKLRPPCDCG